ncbi:MAG: hypothetical protein NVS1B2_15930 [Vulcanimicrobiaceae bacterium]
MIVCCDCEGAIDDPRIIFIRAVRDGRMQSLPVCRADWVRRVGTQRVPHTIPREIAFLADE